MQRITLLLALFMGLGFSTLKAQDAYKHALGLRLGNSYGLSYKTFLSDRLAFEGMFTTRYYGNYYNNGRWNGNKYYERYGGEGFNITGLLEYHSAIAEVEGLQWFLGGGIHIGSWYGYRSNRYYGQYYDEDRSYLHLGVDFMLGIEYTIPNAPINIALDYKPVFNFVGYPRVWPEEFALTARFLLDRL